MRLRHIEIFHAVYSSGSVTRAAKILNVSQPSVSKVLAHAEQQLGYALFDRVKGKLIPTPEADLLFAHVSKVNDSLERMRSVANNLRAAEQGRLRIAATPAFGIDVLPGAIAEFQGQHGEIFFSVETLHHGEICAALLESRIDVGLAFDPGAVPGITRETLARGCFCVLAHRDIDFGGRSALTVADLVGQRFIGLDSRGPLGRLLSKHIQSSEVSLNTVAYAETYQVAKSLVAHGAGVTIADEITARSSGHDNVRVWPLEPKRTFRISALYGTASPVSLIGKAFLDSLRDYLGRFLA